MVSLRLEGSETLHRAAADCTRRCGAERGQKKETSTNGGLLDAAKGELRRGRRSGRLGLRRIDADLVARLALVLELHDAVDQRVDRIVRAEPDVVAGVPARAALTEDDI